MRRFWISLMALGLVSAARAESEPPPASPPAAESGAKAAVPPAADTAQKKAVPSPTTPPESDRFVFVPSGIDRTIGFITQLFPNCSSMGTTEYRVQVWPEHGIVIFEQGDTYSSFAIGSPLQRCNDQKTSGLITHYTSSGGYVGEDHIEVLYLLPTASAVVVKYTVIVK